MGVGEGFDQLRDIYVSLMDPDCELKVEFKRALLAYFSYVKELLQTDEALRDMLRTLKISDVGATITEILTNIALNRSMQFRTSFIKRIRSLQPENNQNNTLRKVNNVIKKGSKYLMDLKHIALRGSYPYKRDIPLFIRNRYHLLL